MQSNVHEERKKNHIFKNWFSGKQFLVTVISENIMSVLINDWTCTRGHFKENNNE